MDQTKDARWFWIFSQKKKKMVLDFRNRGVVIIYGNSLHRKKFGKKSYLHQ